MFGDAIEEHADSHGVQSGRCLPVFRTVCCVHLQGTEDGVSMFFWNISKRLQELTASHDRVITQTVSRRLPTAAARVRAHFRSCGICVDKVALGQVSSEYFGFSCQFSFHRLLHIHHHLSSGAHTIGQLVADVPSGRSLTPTTRN
jgi:hypothetical protein